MKTLRPIAFVLATLLHISLGTVSTWAQDDPSIEPEAGGQISGNLPDSRAGIITLEGLSGTSDLTGGAVPQSGFSYIHDSHYWDRNFYRVDTFLPYNLTPGTDYFFTNLMGAVTQGGDGVVNLGLGYGRYVDDWDRLFRTTAWLDIDDEPNSTLVAIGAQSESLGKYFDTRAGVQFVMSDSTNTIFSGLTGNTQFSGNNLFFEGFNQTETAFNQADFEIGGPLAWLGDYGINMYGRGYFLSNFDTERDALGVGLRGEWTITEDITFNANWTHDDLFGTNTYLSIAVTTPDGAPQHVARPVPVRERFSKRSPRTGRIPVLRERELQNVLAISPKTNNPYVFAHVNPNEGPGDGTVENPFGSIDELITANGPMSPFDAIYVRPATTSVAANDLRIMSGTNLILNDNQYLLGSTIAHMIPVAGGPFGSTVTITPQDPGLPRPVLTNGNIAPGAIVYAANGNTIGGFTLDGEGIHDGIRGDGNSILGDFIDDDVIRMITITNNQFINTNRGIFLPDLSDGDPMPGMPIWSSISFNTFTNNNVAFDVGISTNNNDGTDIDTDDNTKLTMVMLGNVVSGNLEGGILRSQGPDALLDMRERDLDGDGNLNPVFAGNVFENNGGNGMNILVETGGYILADLGALAGTSQNIANPNIFNQFTNNEGNGLAISVVSSEDRILVDGQLRVSEVNMRNNLFDGNEQSGASIETGGDAVFLVHGTRNIYMDNLLHGLEINSFNNSSIGNPYEYMEPSFALLDNNPHFLTNDYGPADPIWDAISASASTFKGEYFINNGQDGAHISAQAAQIAGQVPVNNESWQNIAFLFDDGLGNNGNRRNLFVNNGNDGIRIVNDAVATVNGNQPVESFYTIRGTEIGNSGQDGIHIELLGGHSSRYPEHSVSQYGPNVVTIGGPRSPLVIPGETIDDRVFAVNNGGQGVQVNVEHFDTGIFGGNLESIGVSPNFSGGIYRPDRFYIDQFTALNNADDGFEIIVQLNSDVNFNMFRSNLVQNGGIGLEMDVRTANEFNTYTLDPEDLINDPFNQNRIARADFTRSPGSVFNIGSELANTGNLFQSNALQGVFFQTLSPVPPGNLINLERVVAGIISNDALIPPSPAGTPPQNNQNSLTSGEYASIENIFIRTLGRLNFYNNSVRTNGTLLNGADGLALSVGTSTNMIASIAQNTFGGNAGSDLNIVSVVSQNPEQSIDNRFGSPNRDELAVDPVGILDLALGINFAPTPNPPTSGDLAAGSNPNTGAQFTVNTIGITTPLAGRTELGVFSNTDAVINKLPNRNGFMVINAYGTQADMNMNTWTQSGSTVQTLLNARSFQLGFDTSNTSGLGGIDGFGTIRRGFGTVNFMDPSDVFP